MPTFIPVTRSSICFRFVSLERLVTSVVASTPLLPLPGGLGNGIEKYAPGSPKQVGIGFATVSSPRAVVISYPGPTPG